MADDVAHLLSELDGVLETEAHMLRAGNLRGLGALALQKDGLIAAMVAQVRPDHAAALRTLRAKAAANLRLFDAARAGVAAAQTRLDAIRQAAGGLSTYDRAGQRRTTPTAQPRHERRT